jgi:hypothetical protein
MGLDKARRAANKIAKTTEHRQQKRKCKQLFGKQLIDEEYEEMVPRQSIKRR